MTCPDCTEAARHRWHGFTESCDLCRARQVARLPSYRDSKETGRLTGSYRDMLDVFRVTHEQVKEAAATDFMMNGAGTVPERADGST